MRDNIDFGIDLGTTNSAVAVGSGSTAQILRTARGAEFTPSVVHVGRSGNVRVGQTAADQVVADPGNTVAEFKLRMGRRDRDMLFEASGRTMTPEELSAQVLMAMRGNVELAGERMETAVITVPAAFTVDQTAATMKAAELAGIPSATLLQEPTAAAWAYLSELDEPPAKAFWLVYDFGGGTFDAAVVKIEDGEFTVVNHAGDNSLGGKRVDWALVDDELLPAVRAAHPASTVTRDNPRTRKALAKLKRLAETAKIELSVQPEVTIEEDLEVEGETIELTHTLTRADLDRAARSLVEASIRHCRLALSGAGLGPQDVDRVLLVGGTSQMTLVREMLETDLGIPLDHSQDPITVVARGAAIYAATRRVPEEIRRDRDVDPGTVRLNLDYPAAGLDDDPLVGGRADSPEVRDWSGWSIELRNTTMEQTMDSAWNSGRIELSGDGTFRMRLEARGNAVHTITVTLRDPAGSEVPTDQPTFTYNHRSGMGDAAARASHTVGVGLADNTVQALVEKNVELPRTGRAHGLRTSVAISKSSGGVVSIPILEGEHARADRNTVVGRLDLRPEDITRDLPVGSEVEVEVTIDASFQFTAASVYVVLLDEEFPIHVDRTRPLLPSVAELRSRRAALGRRYDELREQAAQLNATEADAGLDRFDADGFIGEVDRLLHQAAVDQDAVATCNDRLLEADSALDEAQNLLDLPKLADEGRHAVASAEEIVAAYGARELQAELAKIKAEMDIAIADGDKAVIERRTDEAWSIVHRAIPTADRAAIVFSGYESDLGGDPRPDVARLLAEGRTATATGDLGRLQSVNARLRKYVSVQPEPVAGSANGGVLRAEGNR
ncbi:Hsp70 family protein [Promicromonospora panici]|uniref:Hsp70 family protein n=1 Tax=Promicromonospora panici TaxID=2219658 RepID=UPI00101D85A6|nr:Hsp70 family protein [Promicromonospora panici]